MELRNKDEIKTRMAELEARLKEIEEARLKELKKDFFSRNRFVFLFLDVEKKVFLRAANELKWVLNE